MLALKLRNPGADPCGEGPGAGTGRVQRPAGALSYRQLEVFLLVAECRSLSGAAQALGLSVSGVSRLLGQTEAHLGTVLLVRGARPLSLTEAGAAFLPYAQRLLLAFEELASSLAGEKGTASLPLRLAASNFILPSIASSVMRRAAAQRPALAVQFRSRTNEGAQDDVLQGVADLGLCMKAVARAPNLDCQPLLRAPLGLLCVPKLALPRQIQSLRDLDALCFARLESHLMLPKALREAGVNFPAYFDASLVCNSTPALTACVADGSAVTVVSAIGAASPALSSLRFVPLPLLLPPLLLCLVSAPGGLDKLATQAAMLRASVMSDVDWPRTVERL